MNLGRKKILDLQKLNPSWDIAAGHGESTKPGLEPKQSKRHGSIVMCPCCLNVIQKDPVSLGQNSKELSFLGYGFPLFYNMLQFCLINLFILILTEGAILMYMSITEQCQYDKSQRLLAGSGVPYKCTAPFIIISRVSGQTSDIDVLVRILSFCGQIFLLLYFRDSQRKLAAYHVERNLKVQDFSIIFKSLPKVKGIKKHITDFLMNEFKTKCHIQKIVLFPKIDDFLEKEDEKMQIVNKKRKILSQNEEQKNEELLKNIDDQIAQINEQMMTICTQINNKYENDTLYGQKAIVILETEKEKVKVLEEYKTLNKKALQKYFKWMADEVTLKTAPNPKEIIWENFTSPKNQRWYKILLGWALSILFLGSVTVIFYFLNSAKGQRLDQSVHKDGYTDQQYNQAVAIVFTYIVLIQFFNKFLMKIVLHEICKLQKPETTSQLQFSYAFKYAIGMFFTTAVMTLAVEAIQFQNYEGLYGVVEEETIMFFFSAFFVNLLWIVHPQYYFRKLSRKINRGRQDMTQQQANTLMEDYPYDIGKRFAQVIEIMWFTYLYSSLIPIGSLLSFTGFVIYYWVDKYNLLRRSSINNTIQSKLPLLAIKLMEMTIFWKPLGEFIFDYQIRNQILPSTITMLCVSVVYLILPWNTILQLVFEEKFNLKEVKYMDCISKLGNTYEIVDPVQRHIELEGYFNRINKERVKRGGMIYEIDQQNPAFTSTQEINLICESGSRIQE